MSNVFSFMGSLGGDAELKYLQGGQAVLSFNVANNVGFGDKQKTNWVRTTLWGKRAEGNLKDYLKKGQQVFISGELTVNEYTKNSGEKGFSIGVNANIVDLVGKKDSQQQQNYQPPPQQQYAPPPQGYQPPPPQQQGAYYQAAQNGNYQPQPQNYAPHYDADIPF